MQPRRGSSRMARRSSSDLPPPLPPRTRDMLVATRPSTLPRTNYSSEPPPLPPRPGSNTMQRSGRASAGDMLPPLPPSISRSLLPRSVSTPDTFSQVSPGRLNYDTIPVSLSQLTNGFTINVPSSVVVRQLPTTTSNYSLADGDIINLHFTKSTRVVNVLSISGMKVLVPVNSPMLCSVLYDPVDDMDRAENGYIFGSGSQLFDACPLPQFIGVSKGCNQTKSSSMFTNGEILVVKGYSKDGKFLECQTVPDGEPKLVHNSTTAMFTTNPNKIKVHLSEVVKHLEYQIKIKFFPQNVQLQQHMRKPYNLLNVESQKSVIATYGSPKQQLADKYVMEIFSDFPLKCDQIEFTKTEKRNLIRESKALFQSFNPSCVKEIMSNVPPAVSSCQSLLFLTVGQLHGTISRNEPMIHTASITGVRPKHIPILAVSNQPNKYDGRYTSQKPSYLKQDTTRKSDPHENFMDDGFPTIDVHEDPYSLTPGDFGQDGVDEIYDDFGGPRQKQKSIKDLNVIEVLSILERLGLSQYNAIFERERITGSILVRLDDDMLERDFGIKSRLHRMKIMALIEDPRSQC